MVLTVRFLSPVRDATKHPLLTEALTGLDVQERAQSLVSTPQWSILIALIGAHPSDMSREECASASGQNFTSSGYANNLSSLRSMGFLDYSAPGRIRAADILFI
jgi:hypothetical protein